MREIKFRAWDKENEAMREYFTLASEDGEPFDNHGNAYPEWIVMQFTGLKDRTGKEIYEGDIVKEGKKKLEVFWNSIGSGQWWFLDKKCHVTKINLGQLEVIGNIYENPELVKSDG